MIHEIRIENFASIREEVVFDLRIPKTAPDLPRFRQSPSDPDIRLPTVVALFGPNGSGKTTILKAMTATMQFITQSFRLEPRADIPNFVPFRHTEMAEKPIRIRIEFDAGWADAGTPHIYRYELELVGKGELGSLFARQVVAKEALYFAPKGRMRRLFERIRGVPLKIADEFGLRDNDPRVERIRDNCSLISHLAQLDIPLAVKIREDVGGVQSNIWNQERASFKEVDFMLAGALKENPSQIENYNKLMQRSDFGIERLTVGDTSNGPVVQFHHKGTDVCGLMAQESQGTQNFIRLAPFLKLAVENGHIALFDELDNDLHPMLIPEIFDWFQSRDSNPFYAQLFFTAHNTALLEDLEKEEIYLVEKSDDGATNIYGVQDIKGLRREPNLYKQYMRGALGAVPRIG